MKLPDRQKIIHYTVFAYLMSCAVGLVLLIAYLFGSATTKDFVLSILQ